MNNSMLHYSGTCQESHFPGNIPRIQFFSAENDDAMVKRAIFPGIFPGSEQTSCPSRPDVTHYQSTYPWFESSVHPKRETHEASLPYHTRASRANAEPDCLLARELVPAACAPGAPFCPRRATPSRPAL